MRQFCIFAVLCFFAGGIFSAHAQDLIVMRDGNIIEAKVTEISSSEIRYKRYDHLDGPTVVVPAANVLSIRYENGKVEAVNAAPIPATGQQTPQAGSPGTYTWNPEKLNFGISFNPAGLIPLPFEINGNELSLSADFTKGGFNSTIDIR